jgi:type VI protein secretion system component Hcp
VWFEAVASGFIWAVCPSLRPACKLGHYLGGGEGETMIQEMMIAFLETQLKNANISSDSVRDLFMRGKAVVERMEAQEAKINLIYNHIMAEITNHGIERIRRQDNDRNRLVDGGSSDNRGDSRSNGTTG